MPENVSLPDVVEEIMKAVVQIITPTGQGVRFFIREEGLVITNKHVVDKDLYVGVKIKRSHVTPVERQVKRVIIAANAALFYR